MSLWRPVPSVRSAIVPKFSNGNNSDPNIGESDREVQRVSNQLAWKREVHCEGLQLEPKDDGSSNHTVRMIEMPRF